MFLSLPLNPSNDGLPFFTAQVEIYRLSREWTPDEIYSAEETATDSPEKTEDARVDFPENSNPSDDSEQDRINYDSSSVVMLFEGDGTIDVPYLISTPEQLALFRDTVNAGNQSLCAALTNDIDLKNEPWVPIGADSAYQGSFDGRGHSVRNISPSSSVRVQSESIVFYSAGFIGAVGHDGVVKRLNIDGDYTLAMTARELDIGTIAGVNFGTIEDCSVTVNFDLFYWNPKSNSTIGGFVAGNAGKIQNCYFVGSLCPTLTGEIGVGGLIAICLDGSIVTNCYLCGSVRPLINGDNSKSYPGLFGTAEKNIITKNFDLCGEKG